MENDELFRFTRGRFLADEQKKLEERYVRFDVAALGRLAAEAVGAASCVKVEKYHEGTYNKILLLTMDNGSQSIAKVLQPNAGHPHQAVASEVATMDFVREVLDTPVPKVYRWGSTKNNEVGAPYIIMEKSPGVPLSTRWSRMEIEHRTWFLAGLAVIHAKWATISFSQYGSLYYASDVETPTSGTLYIDGNGQSVENAKFAIGPSTSRRNFDNLKSAVEFYRGPWDSVESHLDGLAAREIACVSDSPRFPVSQISLLGPGTYTPTKEKKLRALKCFRELIKPLLPERSVCRSTLWHPDPEGIFVNPENPREIVGFIDWQATELGPLFSQAQPPDLNKFDGASFPGLDAPDDDSFVEQHGQQARDMGRALFNNMVRNMVNHIYNAAVALRCEPLAKALAFRKTDSCGMLVFGSSLFIDGEPAFMNNVLSSKENWAIHATSGTSYPFDFSAWEAQEIRTDFGNWKRAGQAMQRILAMMVDIEIHYGGMVSPIQYVEAKVRSSTLKYQWKQQLEAMGIVVTDEQRKEVDRWWPFDD